MEIFLIYQRFTYHYCLACCDIGLSTSSIGSRELLGLVHAGFSCHLYAHKNASALEASLPAKSTKKACVSCASSAAAPSILIFFLKKMKEKETLRNSEKR